VCQTIDVAQSRITMSIFTALAITAVCLIFHAFKPADTAKCTSIYDQLPQPHACCNAPKFLIPKSIVNGCTQNCSTSNDTCCIHRCVPLESGIFIDGKMMKSKVRQFFEDGIDESDGGDVVKLWKLLVAQTTEECCIKCEILKLIFS
jgi:hypothetical protein